MITLKQNSCCCGCGACMQICPAQCIAMQEDKEGFLYPQVDTRACNDCGQCEIICPIINQKQPKKPLVVYAAKNKNEKVRMQSSSGGIFTLLAEHVISEGGVVFGARFDEKWEVVHDYSETIEGLTAFRGKKYVQSRIENTYKKTELFLKQGRKVLFTGTPCQIAGLNHYLAKKYDNLLTVDVACHGVPSPGVWKKYLEGMIKNPNGGTGENSVLSSLNEKPVITGISFRDKSNGWRKFSFVVKTLSSKSSQNAVFLSETLDKNIFMRGFLKNLYLRPVCYACACKSNKSGADITIADYWGISRYYPEFNDNKGVSLVLCNSPKGVAIFQLLDVDGFETSYEQGLKGNSTLERSVTAHRKREVFYARFAQDDLEPLILNCCKDTLKMKVKQFTLHVLVSLFHLIPLKYRRKVKSLY